MWLKFWKLLILAGSVSFLLVSRGLKRRLSAIFDFKKISNFVTLGMVLFYSCLDHPWTVFGYFYHCAKFNWNPCCSFHKIQVLIFYRMLIHAPKMGEAWRLDPPKGEQSYRDPQKEPSCMDTGWVRSKKVKKVAWETKICDKSHARSDHQRSQVDLRL